MRNRNAKLRVVEDNNSNRAAHGSGSSGLPKGLPIEKWFADKFCGQTSAFQLFIQEYEAILKVTKFGKQHNNGLEYPPFLYPNRSNQRRTIQSATFTVNAHFVEGLNGRNYIACEGPNTSSVYDFWEMVWQEKVEAILMVNTPFEERRIPKTWDSARETIDYWPMVPGKTKLFTPWKIQCVSSVLKAHPQDGSVYEDTSDDYVYRVTRFTLVESNPITKPRPREILHICHYRWPDGQIPEPPPSDPNNYSAGGKLLLDILRKELGGVTSPIVVHCHAGIGRTGVCIALDIAVTRLLSKNHADVRDTVRRIREQRPKSVMNIWQYAYINLVLTDFALGSGLLKGEHCFSINGVSASGSEKEKEKAALEACEAIVLDSWEEMIADFPVRSEYADFFDDEEEEDEEEEEGVEEEGIEQVVVEFTETVKITRD